MKEFQAKHDALKRAIERTWHKKAENPDAFRKAVLAYELFLTASRHDCKLCRAPLEDKRRRYCDSCQILKGSEFIPPEVRI